jgi:hypothetical protein
MERTRRAFLAEVGKGMVIAGVGPALAADLGLASARAAEGPDTLTFGEREPLVCLLEETAPDKLLPILAERLRGGTTLRDLVEAAALANARKFGGEDYVGYHTLMALPPAYAMARALPAERRPLPVFKVLYRNTNRIHEAGGRHSEVLHPVRPADLPAGRVGGEVLREAVRARDKARAEALFAGIARGPVDDAFNSLLYELQDDADVHRVVLVSRAWDLVGLLCEEHAHTLLRQSVRYCVDAENWRSGRRDEMRALLPKLLDQYHLPGKAAGNRPADDAWVDTMAQTIFKGTPAQAATAAAEALAEGMNPEAIGEALSLAANTLLLRDAGRRKEDVRPGKPAGSVHGDSIGVHASDSANAWRNVARAGNPRNRAACLILGAYQAAYDRINRGGDFLKWEPYPRAEHLEKVKANDPAGLLREAEAAIRDNDQGRASAAVSRYGQAGGSPEAVFALLLKYAVSEDGALHAEKYYRTVSEEFAVTRPAFRWRHLTALARVTASEFGQTAPGYTEACHLLKV